MRECGILMPMFSVPSRYGIGTFSKEAREFIDHLAETGQKYWQILPMGPTVRGNSPYDALSGFAGNPYYIDPETLEAKGLLDPEDLEKLAAWFEGDNPWKIDYDKVDESRIGLFQKAYGRFRLMLEREASPDDNLRARWREFCAANEDWLEDTGLFWALRHRFQEINWRLWPVEYKMRDPETIEKAREELREMIDFFRWMQFEFFEEWHELRAYAHSRGIFIAGDMPIYTSADGADNWIHPEIFQLDEDLEPVCVSGCPPDIFSETGQRWGNPLYNWEQNPERRVCSRPVFRWWLARVKKTFELFDVVRIDHFRGLAGYYAIPADSDSALTGEWRKGPGMELFQFLEDELGELNFFAEDLGIITEDVRELLKETGYPGMRVLQFAFESDRYNPNLPDNFPENCVAYTGTHDNDTTLGWYRGLEMHKIVFFAEYMKEHPCGSEGLWEECAADRLIRLAMFSRAKVCIIPIQDYMNHGSEGRINRPGYSSGNWQWKMAPGAFNEGLSAYIAGMARDSGRCEQPYCV